MNPSTSLDDKFVEYLLSQPTLEARSAFLRNADLFHTDGLMQMLEQATHIVSSDPGQARQLAELCLQLTQALEAPLIKPKATYLIAQTHAINGDFKRALNLVRLAREKFVALGQDLEALRTNVGLMNVLCELGRYQEALDAGQTALDQLAETDQFETDLAAPETQHLAALVYQSSGVNYELMGRYEDALEAYRAAEIRYQNLDLTENVGHINNNRGIILLDLGRGSEALAAFEAAAGIFAEADLTLLQAQTLINIGDAYLLLGDYTSSLETFNQAQRLLETLDALSIKYVLHLDMAEAYLALNLYPEALAAYREAEQRLKAAGMAHDRARALRGIGSTMIALGQFTDAEQALAEANALFTAAENSSFLSNVMLEQAALLAARGEREAAVIAARQALALVSEQDWPAQQTYAHLRLADIYLPDITAAEVHLRQAQHLAEALALPQLRYRLNQRLGHVRKLQGRDEEAQDLLEAAMADVEQTRGTLTQEIVRRSFLRDKVSIYEDLVTLYLNNADAIQRERAFAVIEQAKSRALVDMLTSKRAVRSADQIDLKLTGRLQTLQADLNVTYNRLLGHHDIDQPDLPSSGLQARAVELEQEISRLRLQPGATPVLNDPFERPMPLETIQAQIPADIILLTYYICADEIMALISWQGQLHIIRNLSTPSKVQRLLQRLALQWDRFRIGRSFVSQHMTQLEQSTARLLSVLHSELFAPLEPVLAQDIGIKDAGPRKLVVVPHSLLHQVPFQALFDGHHYLLDRFEISYAPSATVFALCQAQPSLLPNRALVLGVPDPLIPAVSTEVETVAQHFETAAVYLAEQATSAILQTSLADYQVLHLACHGLFRADNPMFSALKLYDGWLTAIEIMSLDLSGALVTLSACESGRSQVIEGDELIGLTRAFLGAGATALIVSQWLVQDETTAHMMATLYQQLRQGQHRAAALRTAQLSLKAQHSHPYYWASFVLVGQR